MNLTLNLEDEIILLEKYKLTPNELMLIRALLILQDENDEKLFQSYTKILQKCGVSLRELFQSLQEKEIILKSYKISQGSYDPYAIPFNKNFIKNLYKCSFELGKELFEEYPQFATIQGSLVGLRSVSKKFDSLEDAYFRYGKNIGWSVGKHRHIIDLIKWSKEHNLINYSLSSFIIDKRWLELEALRDGEGNINYDTVTLL